MGKRKADNRTKLIQAAVKVTYRHGFGDTAIADIAKEARVPLGNIYYFKTKDEIGDAIIDLRVSRFRKLLQELNKAESPKERLCGFVQIKIRNREELARSGCPVGTRVPSCKSMAARLRRNQRYCSPRLSRGWKRSSGRLTKEKIRAGSPCIFFRQRKAYWCWLIPSTTPV